MKTKSLGGCAQPLWIVATVCAAGLAGCGGGGGGDGGGVPMLPLSHAPAPAPSPAPSPASALNRDLVAGSELAPTLSAPQPGSTAAVGNDSEGIYASSTSLAFVGADGSVATRFVVGALWGSLKVMGLDWSFKPDTLHYFVNESLVTGSGRFDAKKSMSGRYAYGVRGETDFGPLGYTVENALAVSQDSVVGKWANTDTGSGIAVSIEVDAKGAFKGTTSGVQVGTCAISGTIAQTQAGTAKNMYGLSMAAVDAATEAKDACLLRTDLPYVGPAAIGLVPAGFFDNNGYFRSIIFLVKSGKGAMLSTSLRKQS